MAKKSNARGGARPGAGRRPRYGSPMPRSAFTARPDHILFYLLLSGPQKTVSAGVQMAAPRLAKSDDEAGVLFQKAQWIVREAEVELEIEAGEDEEVTQDMVLRHALDHVDRFIAHWQEQEESG